MLIRADDFGQIKKYKKIWFTCENCGIGVLQLYKNYLNQKDKKLCRSCRNKYSLNQPEVKLKKSLQMKKLWQTPSYRNKNCKSISEGTKRTWKKDDGTRKKIISEATSQGLKNKWQDIDFQKQQKKSQKKIQNRIEVKTKKSKATKELWKNHKYRKKNIDGRKGNSAHNKYSYEHIKEQIEKTGYKLLFTEYKNAHTPILLECNNGHKYKTIYNTFQQGHRCPVCFSGQSEAEKEISDYIKKLGFDILENNRTIISPRELDIVIPSKKLAIEYCGLYWHSELIGKNKNYHLNKLELCNEKGYRLITIFEDEWLNKQEIVKTRLKHILGLNINRIYARNCEIREIETKTAKKFINKYHIQGYNNSYIKLGAFHNNNLVAVITFSKPSIAKGYQKRQNVWEIGRFCLSNPIIGIASKFIKYFKQNYNWIEIFTFADRRWDVGYVYEKIGFEKIGYTEPNYWYFNSIKRLHRYNFRKNCLQGKLSNFYPNLSEWQNMKINGWNRIWDCGNIKYNMKNSEM